MTQLGRSLVSNVLRTSLLALASCVVACGDDGGADMIIASASPTSPATDAIPTPPPTDLPTAMATPPVATGPAPTDVPPATPTDAMNGAAGAPAVPTPPIGVAGSTGVDPMQGAAGAPPVVTTPPPPAPTPGGTATRPVLTDADAANFEILDYLRQTGAVAAPITDNWDPTAGVTLPATPTVVVAPGQSINAAIAAATGLSRIFIQVMPGTYRETVCVPTNAPPITLYGANDTDATATVIVFDNLAGRLGDATRENTCEAVGTNATFGTDRSATVVVRGANFQARSLTIANDADEGEAAANGNTATQGVALLSRGDRAIYQNVRLLGHQDTFEIKSISAGNITRAYLTDSYIEGDVDFIFGRSTAVVNNTEIRSVLTRTGEVRTSGNVLAPSTDARYPFGILINNCTFTTDTSAAARFTLGRAWDEGQILARDPNDPADDADPTYAENIVLGAFPNGQSLVRDSTLGAHLNMATPWTAAASTARAYSSVPQSTPNGDFPANRLFEFGNVAP